MIASFTFFGCFSLESVTFPSTVLSIGNGVFYDCDNLRVVVLHEGIQTIGDEVFHGCVSLESFTSPSATISVGDEAFSDCDNLEVFVLNEVIQTIGDNAFEGGGCSLENFQFAEISKRLIAI